MISIDFDFDLKDLKSEESLYRLLWRRLRTADHADAQLLESAHFKVGAWNRVAHGHVRDEHAGRVVCRVRFVVRVKKRCL